MRYGTAVMAGNDTFQRKVLTVLARNDLFSIKNITHKTEKDP